MSTLRIAPSYFEACEKYGLQIRREGNTSFHFPTASVECALVAQFIQSITPFWQPLLSIQGEEQLEEFILCLREGMEVVEHHFLGIQDKDYDSAAGKFLQPMTAMLDSLPSQFHQGMEGLDGEGALWMENFKEEFVKFVREFSKQAFCGSKKVSLAQLIEEGKEFVESFFIEDMKPSERHLCILHAPLYCHDDLRRLGYRNVKLPVEGDVVVYGRFLRVGVIHKRGIEILLNEKVVLRPWFLKEDEEKIAFFRAAPLPPRFSSGKKKISFEIWNCASAEERMRASKFHDYSLIEKRLLYCSLRRKYTRWPSPLPCMQYNFTEGTLPLSFKPTRDPNCLLRGYLKDYFERYIGILKASLRLATPESTTRENGGYFKIDPSLSIKTTIEADKEKDGRRLCKLYNVNRAERKEVLEKTKRILIQFFKVHSQHEVGMDRRRIAETMERLSIESEKCSIGALGVFKDFLSPHLEEAMALKGSLLKVTLENLSVAGFMPIAMPFVTDIALIFGRKEHTLGIVAPGGKVTTWPEDSETPMVHPYFHYHSYQKHQITFFTRCSESGASA